MSTLEPFLKRVRARVLDPSLIDVGALKAMGAHGVVISGRMVQVVIGVDTDRLLADIRALDAPQAAEPSPVVPELVPVPT
ncbi:MAG: PTS sugar transporter [Bifidobacteriaceae bacterium]|nr:PTS sugar transporter [Bifidobacteriaceae bacterium]